MGCFAQALVDADVATWMGRQLRLKDVREREEQLSSPLQAEKARYMQLKATNQKASRAALVCVCVVVCV